ncbi:MAG: GAF domain-containing protein, partial [Chloroflexi bacterium]|nr:GAF domain-containing protein [Chloroflexota bacterium]
MVSKKLADSEIKRLELLYEDKDEAVEFVRLDGTIVFVNAALMEMHGYAEGELVGRRIKLLCSTDYSPSCPYFSDVPIANVWTGAVRRVRKSGEEFAAHLVLSPFNDEQGERIGSLGVVIDREPFDLTDHVGESMRSTDEALAEIGRIVSSSLDIDDFYRRFADATRRLVPFDNISICTVGDKHGIVTTKYASGPDTSGRKSGDTFDLAGTVVEEVIKNRSSILLEITEENADKIIDRFPALGDGIRSGIRTLMGVPLISKGQIAGVMLARSNKIRGYSVGQLALFERVGVQIAGAISNSHHHAKLHEKARSRDVVAGIGLVVSSSPEIEDTYEALSQQIGRHIAFDRLIIVTVDESEMTAQISHVAGQAGKKYEVGQAVNIEDSHAAEVVQAKSGMVFNPKSKAEISEKYPYLLRSYEAGNRSFLSVPLLSKDQVVGLLLLRSITANAYSDSELSLANEIGAQIAGGVASARLRAQLQREVRERETLADISRVISSSPDIDEVFERFVGQAQRLFSFDRIAINRVDRELGTVTAVHRSGLSVKGRHRGEVFPLPGTTIEEMISKNCGLLVQNIDEKDLIERYPGLSNGFDAGLRSFITVPLRSRDQIMGALMIRSKSPNAYTLHELRLAERLGDQIAGAISNSHHHAELHERARSRDVVAGIGLVVSSSPEIEDTYGALSEQIRKYIPFDCLIITTVDKGEMTARISHVVGEGGDKYEVGQIINIEDSFAAEMVRTKSDVVFNPKSKAEISEKCPYLMPSYEAGIRSYLAVPLLSKDKVVGLLSFRSITANAYSESQLSIAAEIGAQIAGGVASARLRAQLQREVREREILAEIGRIISSSPDIDEVFERFVEQAKELISFDRIAIDRIDLELGTVSAIYRAGVSVNGRHRGEVFPLPGTTIEEMISKNSGLLVQGLDKEEMIERYPGLSNGIDVGLRSFITAPLRSRDQIMGALIIRSKSPNAYTPHELRLAERLGDQIAGAIANAKLHETLERDAAERQVLADIGRTMSSSLVMGEVFEQFADLASRVVAFDRISVAVIDWDRQIISNLHHYGDTVEGRSFGDETPLKGTTVEETVKRDSGVIIQDVPPEEIARLYPGSAAGVKVGFRSFMTVPLRSRDKIIGAIVMRSYRPLAFDQRDLDLAQRVADQIAGAVDGSQLYLELKKTEEALKESLDRFDLAAQGSGDGLWDSVITSRGEDGDYFHEDDFIYLSPRLKELLGYEDHEFPNDLRNWFETIHPDDLKVAKQAAIDHFEHKRPYEVEYRARTKSGEYRWFSSRGQALWDESGRPIRLMGFMRDVTDQKSLEAQLLRSQKMDAFGQLAGGVAHDLNNMLSAIMSYTHLAKTARISETRELHLGEVLKASERAAVLISQLLVFSRKQIINPRTVDLNDVVADVERMLRRLMGEGIRLVTKLDPDVRLVEVDPGQIEQVLVNLSVNSKDAMPNGGTLLIETSGETVDGKRADAMPELSPGAYAVITVQDTGAGIPDDAKDHIFEPFFTTKEVGKGNGLGLSTCYGIIAQSGGYITVESVVGKGSTFKIYFPAKDGLTESLPFRDDSGYLPVGTERILVVEDEPLVRNVAVHVLREQGYTVIEASNGLEALDVASQHQGGPVDLLLTDMVMPVMGGRKLAERLRDIHPEMKVIFTSGYTEDEAFKEEVLNERTNFMRKPFDPSTLTRKVREVLQDGVERHA